MINSGKLGHVPELPISLNSVMGFDDYENLCLISKSHVQSLIV